VSRSCRPLSVVSTVQQAAASAAPIKAADAELLDGAADRGRRTGPGRAPFMFI
jgi:hypothetical protein